MYFKIFPIIKNKNLEKELKQQGDKVLKRDPAAKIKFWSRN